MPRLGRNDVRVKKEAKTASFFIFLASPVVFISHVTAAWKTQVFRFLAAQTISLFGSSLVQYAIIWHIALSTSSGMMMTWATVCGFGPQLLISPYAGALLDRYDRKLMMILADTLIALATLSAAILLLYGHASTTLLFAILLVRSAATGIQTPAVNAFLPQITPPGQLMRVNGINATLSAVTIFISPAASAVVLGYLSLPAVFLIDVITAAIGISIMFSVHSPGVPTRAKNAPGGTWNDIKAGFAYLKQNRFVRQQIGYLAVVGILVSPAAFLTPLLVSRSFGPEVWRLSTAEMTFSAGATAGGLLIAVWGGFKNKRVTLLAATAFYGLMMLGMGFASTFICYLLFNFLIGIALPCYNTPLNTALQQRSDPALLGRVFSLAQIASAAALPLGTLFFGPMADMTSVQALLICSGTVLLVFVWLTSRNKKFVNG